jgi:hypothetical protein
VTPTVRIVVTDTTVEWTGEDVVSHTGVEFGLQDGDLVMYVDVAMVDVDVDDELTALASRLLVAILERHGGELLSVEHNESYIGESPWPTLITIRPATRGRTLDQLYRMAVDVAALIDAASS